MKVDFWQPGQYGVGFQWHGKPEELGNLEYEGKGSSQRPLKVGLIFKTTVDRFRWQLNGIYSNGDKWIFYLTVTVQDENHGSYSSSNGAVPFTDEQILSLKAVPCEQDRRFLELLWGNRPLGVLEAKDWNSLRERARKRCGFTTHRH